MKKILLGTVALVVLGMAGSASAADLAARPDTQAPANIQPQVYNWTGFYIGGHVGGNFLGDGNIGSSGTFMGGVQIGYDMQFSPNWVAGLEADYTFKDTNSAFASSNLGSVTGRLGYTWGQTMLYAKGGYAFTNGRGDDGGHDGYTVGTGLERLFTQNWSGKIEYQYYNFGNVKVVDGGTGWLLGRFRNDEHTIKVGVNYRF